MNEDYTLTTFAEPITALADDPQLPPDEMKRRLQAPADELLEAHNALAGVVHGITEATYPDTVTEDMLADVLSEKINSKAEQAALTAEQTAREDADDALDTRLTTVETQKCEVYFGSYTGNGAEERTINIGFTPKAILTSSTTDRDGGNEFYDGLALPGKPVKYSTAMCLPLWKTVFPSAITAMQNVLTKTAQNTITLHLSKQKIREIIPADFFQS